MLKSEAINNAGDRWRRNYDLQQKWERLIDEAWDDAFDYEFFKNTAAHTFTYLFELNRSQTIPRESLPVLFKIKHFATLMFGGISDEFEAAKLVAQEFCSQIEDCWVQTEDGFSEDVFVVAGADGMDYFIDTNTFDLTELMESLAAQ